MIKIELLKQINIKTLTEKDQNIASKQTKNNEQIKDQC